MDTEVLGISGNGNPPDHDVSLFCTVWKKLWLLGCCYVHGRRNPPPNPNNLSPLSPSLLISAMISFGRSNS